MAVTIDQIKKLREQTGVSMMACKKALEDSNGDFDKAIEFLRKKGMAKAQARSEKTTGEGVIASYIHSNNKIGVLVHLACETDFVAKNDDFKEIARNLAMHIAASAPLYISPEEVPQELIDKEKEIWKDQLKSEGKPEKIWEQIMQGKENKFRDEISVLRQPYVKNPEISVEQMINDAVTKLGENIKLVKFVRYSI